MRNPGRPFAIVVWDDAKVINDETKIEDIANSPTTRFYTAGWVVKSTPEGVWIAAEYAPEDHNWRTITSVPRGMIVEENLFNLSKKAKKRDRTLAGPPSDLGGTGVSLPTPDGKPPQ